MTWVHAVIDVPEARHDTAARFWAAAPGWPAGAPWSGHPELSSFQPPRGRPYVHLQRIVGPARIHVDVESHDVDAAARRAEQLGARVVAAHEQWRTLASPGGLPFCVVAAGDPDPPGPVAWADGHSTRMVQVCIDSPVVGHGREVAFWRALLSGRWVDSPAPEFAGKWHDDAGSPVQLLFQRLGEPEGPVRAHLDLGTDDLSAEVDRLLALGAEDVHPGRGWRAMRDPSGLLFCATENSPATTQRRDIG